tara:strand:+ start:1344 stop:1484 length:141 start_codon:yes stop_codon:yes gene_type:complete
MNIEQLGVQQLSAQEEKSIEGGLFWWWHLGFEWESWGNQPHELRYA